MAGATGDVSIDVDIDEAETLIRVSGTSDAAVIVYSASGEEIYLPPEGFDESGAPSSTGSHYDPAPEGRSPYEGAAPDDSPYEAADGGDPGSSDAEGGPRSRPVGVTSTPDGFRVLHPEPVTDVRVLR